MNSFSSKPYALCFDTLSNDLRLKVITSLQQKEKSVQELSEQLGVEQSRLSHSLRVLRECNYVNVHSKGKERIYSLKQGVLTSLTSGKKSVFQLLDEHIEHYCHNECNKLKSYASVER